MTTINEWTLAISQADMDVERTRQELIRKARALAADMERLANRLDTHPLSSVNRLGEVQSTGATVDRLCAELYEARQNRERLVALRDRLAEEAQDVHERLGGTLRACRAVVALEVAGGAMPDDWPEWWDHEGSQATVTRNHTRLETEITDLLRDLEG